MGRERIVEARVVGDEQLQKVLKDLGGSQSISFILKPALLEVADPVKAAMAAAAPRSHGYEDRHRRAMGKIPLNQTIGISFKKSGGRNAEHGTSVARVRIGPTYPAGAHGHFTEFGTADRRKYLKNQLGLKILRYGSPGKHFVLNPRSKSGRGWWAGVPQYVRGAFSGRTPAQHWMLRVWNSIITKTLRDLDASVSRRLLERAAYLRNKYGEGGEGGGGQ